MYARMLLETAIAHAKAEWKAAKDTAKPLPDRRVLAVFFVKCEADEMKRQRRYDRWFDCCGLLQAMRDVELLSSLLELLVAAEKASTQDQAPISNTGPNSQNLPVEAQSLFQSASAATIYNDAATKRDHDALMDFIAGVVK